MRGKKERAEKSERSGTERANKETAASFSSDNAALDGEGMIGSKAELKSFLLGLRDKMAERAAAPIYASSAMNHVLTLPNIYDLLDGENKEIARDIMLRIRQSGMQVKNPPMLFGEESVGGADSAPAK